MLSAQLGYGVGRGIDRGRVWSQHIPALLRLSAPRFQISSLTTVSIISIHASNEISPWENIYILEIEADDSIPFPRFTRRYLCHLIPRISWVLKKCSFELSMVSVVIYRFWTPTKCLIQICLSCTCNFSKLYTYFGSDQITQNVNFPSFLFVFTKNLSKSK